MLVVLTLYYRHHHSVIPVSFADLVAYRLTSRFGARAPVVPTPARTDPFGPYVAGCRSLRFSAAWRARFYRAYLIAARTGYVLVLTLDSGIAAVCLLACHLLQRRCWATVNAYYSTGSLACLLHGLLAPPLYLHAGSPPGYHSGSSGSAAGSPPVYN